MSSAADFTIQQLTADDEPLVHALLDVFGEAFEDAETYAARRPGAGYLRRLLAGDTFVALVARAGSEVIGGLAAYELHKLEQERSEFYIYDLAVAGAPRQPPGLRQVHRSAGRRPR